MRSSRFLVVLLLAFALIGAQALGLMHRLVHGPQAHLAHALQGGGGHAHEHPQAHDHEHDDDHAGHHHHDGTGWAAALFAGHDDESTCRLFDPLSHEGLPGVPMLALPLALSTFFLDRFQGDFLVRWAALFDARGPPALR
ncbi:hypothetical protein Rta_11110 [Ramlibacter tataouinensis TTB310]|uniref:DUF2946 domain-containing protein n=2 Tax=Ramlibacter tataouinensis TaxID=94132 RepID=F5Y0X8_RAMTT|nr:hypothetical protein Rta_11110 [Ramlibacter tataouinensis TTB310]